MQLLERLPQHADRIAIAGPEGEASYAELLAAAENLAGRLEGLLGERAAGARIAFRVSAGFGYVATLLGIWRAGGVAVPLALSHPERELEHVIDDSGAALLIGDGFDESALGRLASARELELCTWREMVSDSLKTQLELPAEDRDAMILYTSGSTGRPKGVVHTHAGLSAQMQSLVEAWGWSADDRIVNVLPLHHVHGIVNVLGCALWCGARWETLLSFDAAAVWERFESSNPTLLMAVPTIYRRLVEHWHSQPTDRQRELSRAANCLRLMVSGSAALPVRLFEAWEKVTGHRLLERYGMTEIGMALSNPLEGERRPGSVGEPLPGIEVRRVDEQSQVIEGEEAGEIEVRGPGVFQKYWRRPKETREAFHDGWFRTGDIAVVERGVYRILGRRSVDIIKTGGYKVSALEIEAVFAEHPGVAEIAVVGVPDDEWGERLSAAVVPRRAGDKEKPTLEALRTWGRERLAPYKLPRSLLIVDELPVNALGKVVKPRVIDLFAGTPSV